MLFTSFDFLVFFAVVFVVQRLLPHQPRNYFLLAASCFFYGCWNWKFLGLVWVTIGTDYFVSRRIEASENTTERRRLLFLSCVVNLSVLGFFKYTNFFAESIASLLQVFSAPVNGPLLNIMLPVGISFYTFQSMSYVIDVYRRQMPALKRIWDYALYVTIFPQLVAGPIERGAHLAAQIGRKTSPTWNDFQDGAWLILKGLFKKAVMADNLAVYVDQVFSGKPVNGFEILVGTYAFAFQIYGDFSGYTDIARGIGKFLGYDFMLNFRRPYLATDPSDFWQRWHISLSSWLRDYLYIPLGGNRGSRAATSRNLMITMLLGGLWHGAAWNFVIWGAFHGALLIVSRLCGFNAKPTVGSTAWWIRILVMFHVTCIGWLIFRAVALDQLLQCCMAMFGTWQISELSLQTAWSMTLLCLPVMGMQLLEELCGEDRAVVGTLSIVPRTAVYAGVSIAILVLGSFGGREFIYFQF